MVTTPPLTCATDSFICLQLLWPLHGDGGGGGGRVTP